MKKRFTEEQIIGIPREAETRAMAIKSLYEKHENFRVRVHFLESTSPTCV